MLLFILAIVIVFRGIPYGVGLVVIPVALLFMDRKVLKMVDYPLLLTFVFFFIFSEIWLGSLLCVICFLLSGEKYPACIGAVLPGDQ